jgi:hypothetical protein
MFYRTALDVKIPDSDYSAVFSFAQDLVAGETITIAGSTATVYSGEDAAPSTILSGAPVAAGKQVTQLITGGVLGVTYSITCTGTTSLGQVLTRMGYLVVVPSTL